MHDPHGGLAQGAPLGETPRQPQLTDRHMRVHVHQVGSPVQVAHVHNLHRMCRDMCEHLHNHRARMSHSVASDSARVMNLACCGVQPTQDRADEHGDKLGSPPHRPTNALDWPHCRGLVGPLIS